MATSLPNQLGGLGAWALALPLPATATPPRAAKPEPFAEADRGLVEEPVGGAAKAAHQHDHDHLALSGPRAMLRQGSCGTAVRDLQLRLTAAGFPTGGADGEFGEKTKAAVKRYQRAKGLTVDGIVGRKTWAALTGGPEAAPPPAAARHTDAVRTRDGQMVRRGDELIAARIAPAYDRMVAAAKRDGVRLTLRDGYRSRQEQVVLWNRYGHDRSRVAMPGHSNHQSGTAMDFDANPGAWRWLKRHASKFGFHNYAPEPWHYSLTGR
jgi:hypothetical protein